MADLYIVSTRPHQLRTRNVAFAFFPIAGTTTTAVRSMEGVDATTESINITEGMHRCMCMSVQYSIPPPYPSFP